MDRAFVAAFYRAKGYTVREAMLATGHSGNNHRVPLLCEGPLGNLAIFFGDAGGVDAPEMGGARRVAKDLGATPILAAATFSNTQRAQAAELGVVLLDQDAIAPEATPPVPSPKRPWPEAAPSRANSLTDEFAAHPWPDSGRPGGRDGTHATTFEVDELLRDLDRPLPTATTPVNPQTRVVHPVGPAEPTLMPTGRGTPPPAALDRESLWRNQRPGDGMNVGRANASATLALRGQVAGPATAKFAWLGLPSPAAATTAPLEVDLEHAEVLHAHEAEAAGPPAPSMSAEELAYRRLRQRVWLRRGLWTAGAGLFVYLFSLWWF